MLKSLDAIPSITYIQIRCSETSSRLGLALSLQSVAIKDLGIFELQYVSIVPCVISSHSTLPPNPNLQYLWGHYTPIADIEDSTVSTRNKQRKNCTQHDLLIYICIRCKYQRLNNAKTELKHF